MCQKPRRPKVYRRNMRNLGHFRATPVSSSMDSLQKKFSPGENVAKSRTELDIIDERGGGGCTGKKVVSSRVGLYQTRRRQETLLAPGSLYLLAPPHACYCLTCKLFHRSDTAWIVLCKGCSFVGMDNGETEIFALLVK